MSLDYKQGWAVAAHDFDGNKHQLLCGCFSDIEGGDEAARDNAKFIALMLNLREETGLTGEQIRSMLLAAPKMQIAISAAFECGMVPRTSATEGGASRYGQQVLVADLLREALALAEHAKG